MFIDGFNVEGMCKCGRNASCTIIALACLALPEDIRYKPEYMYILIVPGPNHMTSTQIQYFLHPLISQMADSWKYGIHFTWTALHPAGLTARCAVAGCVMDLPGACIAAGFTPPTANIFCYICKCTHKADLQRTDYQDWEMQDDEVVQQLAEKNRDTSDPKDQFKMYEKNGIRWSELWRLPYWQPTQQLVVEPAHSLLEGVAHFHFRYVLGLTSTTANATEIQAPAFAHEFTKFASQDEKDSMPKNVNALHRFLTASLIGEDPNYALDNAVEKLEKHLMTKTLPALKFISEDLSLQPTLPVNHCGGRVLKIHWVKSLIKWVSLHIPLA